MGLSALLLLPALSCLRRNLTVAKSEQVGTRRKRDFQQQSDGCGLQNIDTIRVAQIVWEFSHVGSDSVLLTQLSNALSSPHTKKTPPLEPQHSQA